MIQKIAESQSYRLGLAQAADSSGKRRVLDYVEPRQQRRFRMARQLVASPVMLCSVAFLLIVVAFAIAPGFFAPHDPEAQSLTRRLLPPLANVGDTTYWLGTDSLGRDMLSRVIFGARISVIVALAGVVLSGAVGVVIGVVSGYYGGLIDDFFGWLVNVQLSFPFLLLAVAVAAVLGPGLRNIIIVLAVTTWVSYSRVMRGQVLTIRDSEYVQAARVIGASDRRLLAKHVLPNTYIPLIVIVTFEVARLIIAEASLSFLGLGTAGLASWGTLMADGRAHLATSWWIATMPGIAIMITVLAINLIGDWLRDVLDPRFQRR
ncbi:MAG: ABC transporter permease [Thermomicrobiales bacterium]|nr:ABC transporter permease [Thermomicrobiales bacterium]